MHSIDKIWYLVREFDQEETSLRQKEFTTFREYWVLYDSFLFKAKGIVEKDFYLKEDFFSKKWEEFLEGKWDLKKRNTKV